MASWNPYRQPLERPLQSLFLFFVLWKALLLVVALASPSIGYDTSTAIFISDVDEVSGLVNRLTSRMVKWDALYIVKVAQRGFLWEQEWAFSWGYSRVVSVLAKLLTSESSLTAHIVTGIAVAHAAHFSAILVLYRLVIELAPSEDGSRLAFVAAALHVISPAGLFLSAPYSESLFCLLNFSGSLCYVTAIRFSEGKQFSTLYRRASMIASGLCFAAATSVRSNGLFSGMLFAHQLILVIGDIFSRGITLRRALSAGTIVAAGLLTGLGLIIPQWLAYNEFCFKDVSAELRPWCSNTLPSIYTWVQLHYWNVGFLRYWSASNIPLFLLAAPMIYVLLQTDLTLLSRKRHDRSVRSNPNERPYGASLDDCLRRLAFPQVTLACLALTNFHVQIVNRLSSGYPLWYIYMAMWLSGFPLGHGRASQIAFPASAFVRCMAAYALIQGTLYASFLPPA